MRKIIVICAVVSVACAGFALSRMAVAPLSIEAVMPAGPAVYVRVSRIEKQWNQFQRTKLWSAIQKIDVPRVLEKSGAAEEDIGQYRKFTSESYLFLSGLLLDKLFGQEVAVGVYSGDAARAGDPKAFFLEQASDVILITRPKPGVEVIDIVSKIAAKFNTRITTRQEKYKDHTISIIEGDRGFAIGYVKIKDLLVFGSGTKAARACIDTITKTKPSLAGDARYRAATTKIPSDAVVEGYLDFPEVLRQMEYLRKLIPSEMPSVQAARLDAQMAQLAGFKTLVFGSTMGTVDKSKSVVTFDKTAFDPFLAKMYSTKPAANRTLQFVPKNSIAYQWSLFEPEAYWKYIVNESKKVNTVKRQGTVSLESVASGMEQAFGINIEKDIIPALGNEVGGFLSDIDVNGIFPVPKIAFFLQVKDAKAVDTLLGEIARQGNLPVQSNTYKQVPVSYVALPFGKDIQPAYCFLDGYFLIATSSALLEACIDSRQSKDGALVADSDFQALDPGLTGKNNSVFFLKPALLAERLKSLTAWALRWAQMMPPKAPASDYRGQLRSLQADLQAKESELAVFRSQAQALRDAIASSVIQGVDTASQEASLADLHKKIAQYETVLADAKAREEELLPLAARGPRHSFDPSMAGVYADELIYPVLEGLSAIRAIGSHSIFKEDSVEVFSYCLTEK